MKESAFIEGLGSDGVGLYLRWKEQYSISSEDQLYLLSIAAESWDVILQCRKEVNQTPFIESRNGLREHPGIRVGRQAKIQAMQALKQLELENTVEDDPLMKRLRSYR